MRPYLSLELPLGEKNQQGRHHQQLAQKKIITLKGSLPIHEKQYLSQLNQYSRYQQETALAPGEPLGQRGHIHSHDKEEQPIAQAAAQQQPVQIANGNLLPISSGQGYCRIEQQTGQQQVFDRQKALLEVHEADNLNHAYQEPQVHYTENGLHKNILRADTGQPKEYIAGHSPKKIHPANPQEEFLSNLACQVKILLAVGEEKA